MSKLTLTGFGAWFGAILILGYQALCYLTQQDNNVWLSISMADVFKLENLAWIDDISWLVLKNSVAYLVSMPLFLLFFCIGLGLFIVNGMVEK